MVWKAPVWRLAESAQGWSRIISIMAAVWRMEGGGSWHLWLAVLEEPGPGLAIVSPGGEVAAHKGDYTNSQYHPHHHHVHVHHQPSLHLLMSTISAFQ